MLGTLSLGKRPARKPPTESSGAHGRLWRRLGARKPGVIDQHHQDVRRPGCRRVSVDNPILVRVSLVESCDLLCLDLEAAEEVRAALNRGRAVSIAGAVKALADPTRLLIVQALARRELCGCDLAWVCGCSDKLVSHHLGRLRRQGLVSSRREGKIVFAALTERGRSTLAMAEAVVA